MTKAEALEILDDVYNSDYFWSLVAYVDFADAYRTAIGAAIDFLAQDAEKVDEDPAKYII